MQNNEEKCNMCDGLGEVATVTSDPADDIRVPCPKCRAGFYEDNKE